MNDNMQNSYRLTAVLIGWVLSIATAVYAVGYRNADMYKDITQLKSDSSDHENRIRHLELMSERLQAIETDVKWIRQTVSHAN